MRALQRLAIYLLMAVCLSFGANLVTPDGGVAWAKTSTRAKKPAPKKATATKKKSTASKKKRKKPRPLKLREPVLPDDPKIALGEALEQHVDAYLKTAPLTYGAFVAIDVKTGEVLTVSERKPKGAKIANPAISSGFPAASIFKIITFAALYEGNHATRATTVKYHGGSSGLTMGNLVDSPKRDRQRRSLGTAFAYSTNSVFGKLAVNHLTIDELVSMAEVFGFNKKLSVDGRETRLRTTRPGGQLGLGRMAAGFTNSFLSPLHGAALAAMIANGGYWPEKILVNGQHVDEQVLSDRTVRNLKAVMVQAATGGTGTRHVGGIRDPKGGGSVALKTGTLNSRDGSGLHNSWMVGFFPAEKPRIAFASLVSIRGGGAMKSGHLTKYALKTLLMLEKNRAGRY